jgi:hypothetical protein
MDLTRFVGSSVRKSFPGHRGRVVYDGSVTFLKVFRGGETLFHVEYTDGDEEDLTLEELRKVLCVSASNGNHHGHAHDTRASHGPSSRGDDDLSQYVGRFVRKMFTGFGYFDGVVTSVRRESPGREALFRVVYSDNDQEDLSLGELQKLLLAKSQTYVASHHIQDVRKRKRGSSVLPGDQNSKKGREQMGLPPLPCLYSSDTVVLDEKMVWRIVSFLDPASYCTLTALSKMYRDALIPRQKKVWIGGFLTFRSFQKMDFVGMELFSARHCAKITSSQLISLVRDSHVRYPALSAVDLTDSSHKDLNNVGINALLGLGTRLKHFIMGDSRSWKTVTDAQVRSIARAPALELLSLCVGSRIGASTKKDSLKALESHPTLRKLYLFLDTNERMMLPEYLPRLELLVLDVRGPFDWKNSFGQVRFPNLRAVYIWDACSNVEECETLCAEYLIEVMSRSPRFQKLVIKRVNAKSKLHAGGPEEEDRLFEYLKENRIEYYGPEHLSAARGAVNKAKLIHKKTWQ